MEKKTTWIAIAVVAVLIAGIAFAVSRLYGGTSGKASAAVPTSWDVLRAVPSDAVAVAVFDGSRDARRVISDSTGLLKPLLAGETPGLMGYLSAVGEHRTAVALLTSGALVPVVVTKTDKADSAKLAAFSDAASKAGLKSAVKENFFIASPSETFIGSSVRHIDEGSSVLGMNSLKDLLPQTGGPAVFFLSHSHASKLLQVYSTPARRKQSATVKDLTSWSAFSVSEITQDQILLKGSALPGSAPASFFAAFAGAPAQEALFPEALPYFTSKAVSAPVHDGSIGSRKHIEDGRGRLSRTEKALKEKAGRELTPEEWFRSLQAKEIVRASFNTGDGVGHDVLLVRSAKDLKLGKEARNAYSGVIALVMGEKFEVTDTLCSSVNGRWSVFGDLPSVRAFADPDFLDYTLKDRMSDAGIPQASGFVAYASLSDFPDIITDLFSGREASALKDYVNGAGYAPAVASLDLSGEVPLFRIRIDKKALKGSKVQVLERDTVVVVPGGLFPVKNFSTGKTNYLYQNSHKSICLRDDAGKDVWGVPFKEDFCGRVQDIDYFGNGKIQFLFAAGTKLYAIDRLGHWVNGFPVDLGKAVLLGPDVYDFTGANGYTVTILHKDNTVERYNLHGRRPEGWKGIKAPETVKNLPELLQNGEKRYWVVRTSIRTLVYPFEGGEPLVLGEGTKMLKPDAVLTLGAKGVKGECYDGKTREFKLN